MTTRFFWAKTTFQWCIFVFLQQVYEEELCLHWLTNCIPFSFCLFLSSIHFCVLCPCPSNADFLFAVSKILTPVLLHSFFLFHQSYLHSFVQPFPFIPNVSVFTFFHYIFLSYFLSVFLFLSLFCLPLNFSIIFLSSSFIFFRFSFSVTVTGFTWNVDLSVFSHR